MRKIKYDSKKKQFIVNDSRYLDVLNWRESFKRFILESLKSSDRIEIDTDAFSKSKFIVPKFSFTDECGQQIYLIRKLYKDSDYRKKVLWTSDANQLNEFKKHINSIYNSTLVKLNILRNDINPKGYEVLNDIVYKGSKVYSIESSGLHRIQYVPKLPYRINLCSILFHYNDTPDNKFDSAILNEWNNLVEYDSFKKQSIQLVTLEFLSDIDLAVKRLGIKDK